jgi:hypothetical protein
MRKFFVIFLLGVISINSGLAQTVVGINTSSSGWKRVAELRDPDGRGFHQLTIFTNGGSYTPYMSTIKFFKGWNNYGGMFLTNQSTGAFWTEARITFDAAKAFLELKFDRAITQNLYAYVHEGSWGTIEINQGTLPDGGGAVVCQAQVSKFNIDNNFTIDYDGNVGVGVATPNASLDMKGKAKFRGENGGKAIIDESLAAVLVGTGQTRLGTIGSYFPGIGFNHLLTYSSSTSIRWDNQMHAWIGTRLVATPASELSALVFATTTSTGEPHTQCPTEKMVILPDGNVGIGKMDPENKLDVNGTIRATEIKVEAKTADFVFEKDYELRPLEEVDAFVKEHKHLPEVASAEEMERDGVKQSEMNQKLLQKIEEITLYMIEMKKELKTVKQENQELKSKINSITNE